MPTPTSYIYSIAVDTSNAKANVESLQDQIIKSPITTAIEYINIAGDSLIVAFKDSLSSQDIETLDSLIAIHDGNPLTPIPVVALKTESVPTQGYYQSNTVSMIITQSGLNTLDVSWPFNVSLIGGSYQTDVGSEGDWVDVIARPDTVVGVLTQDTVSGSATLHVSQTVVDNLAVGFEIKLYDSTTQSIFDCERVLAIDKINKTITVETAPTEIFSAANTVYIQVNVYYVIHHVLGDPGVINLGRTTNGASHVPAGAVIRFNYYNDSGVGIGTKRFLAILEYYY